jgi:hypothetical protein
MTRIVHPSDPGHAAAEAAFSGLVISAYIDTVEVFFWQLRRNSPWRQLRSLGMLRRSKWGWRLSRNQPSRVAVLQLDRLTRCLQGVLTRFDVALDMQVDDPPKLQNWLVSSSSLRWRKAGPLVTHQGEPRYWAPQRSPRNLVLYGDRHNKMTGETPCVHLELRFRGKSVRAQGITTVAQLLTLNPRQLFQKHVRWSDIGYRYFTKKPPRQEKPPKGWTVEYVTKRRNHLLKVLELDRTQTVKGMQRMRAEPVSPLIRAIPTSLEWKEEKEAKETRNKPTNGAKERVVSRRNSGEFRGGNRTGNRNGMTCPITTIRDQPRTRSIP